jgi:hypothetical protein
MVELKSIVLRVFSSLTSFIIRQRVEACRQVAHSSCIHEKAKQSDNECLVFHPIITRKTTAVLLSFLIRSQTPMFETLKKKRFLRSKNVHSLPNKAAY